MTLSIYMFMMVNIVLQGDDESWAMVKVNEILLVVAHDSHPFCDVKANGYTV